MSIQMETSPEIAAEALPALQLPQTPDCSLPIFRTESTRARRIWLGIAATVVCVYAVFTLKYWAPADGGVDQNAYLLGGRMIAEHFTTRYTLPNPYAYVGGMMMRTSAANVPGGDYYPKYPLGLPLLYAMFFWIFGATKGASLAFLVSPISSIMAMAGMFFLARLLAGSFAGLMAAILLGTSQLMIELSNNPNSHASCVAFIVWGMYALFRWWHGGGIWRGILAGFLIGYACLIRYSEGLLVLPIAIACASRLRWNDWKSYFRCAVPGLAWVAPVAMLLIYNKHSMGNWTGYDSTNESEGFTWVKFTQTWEQMLRTYYDTGAFFVLPFGLAGIFIAFGRSWKLGLMMLFWLLPGSALYTAYYWSPDTGIGYARFFLTFLPAIMLGAAICFSDGILQPVRSVRWYLRLPRTGAVLVVVGIAASLGVYRSVHGMQQGRGGGFAGGMQPLAEQTRVRQNLAALGQVLLNHVPVNAVLFTDANGSGPIERPLNYIQFLRHWDTYTSDAFDSTRRGGMGGINGLVNNLGFGAAPDPNPVPTTRQKLQTEYESLWANKPFADRHREELKVIDGALKDGRGVFALATVADDSDIRRMFNLVGKYRISLVQTWSDLPPLPPDPVSADPGNTNGRNRGGNFFGGGGGGGGGGRGRGNGPGGGGLGAGPGGGRRGNGGLGASASEISGTKWELLEIKPAS